jgi:NAD(P)-dependent dehydrogenase (short-subunit alcohol dehydrogenase family)
LSIRFDDQVVIVTGSGHGLGKSHALEFARRGACVVVNDLGASLDGIGEGSDAAREVVAQIEAEGGEAMANGANVTDYGEVEAMVADAIDKWGRVDVLVNNAGILRDKTFGKIDLADFAAVVDVHLYGSVNCTKAVWGKMCEQEYGRIVMTSSSSGIYGNFGQTNYGAAKMSVVGFMNALWLEGQKYGIKVNALSPIAATRMTENLIPEHILAMLQPEAVTPAVIFLASEDAPNRQIIAAGAGVYARVVIQETPGIFLPEDQRDAEHIAAAWEQIADTDGQVELQVGSEQTTKHIGKVSEALGLKPE